MINLILVGESCSGKSTVLKYFVENYGFTAIPTYTDRVRRENDDPHYVFVPTGSFSQYNEYDEVTTFDGCHYGKKKKDLDPTKNNISIVDLNGVEFLKSLPNSHVIYVYASPELRLSRLRQRYAPDEQKVLNRFNHDKSVFTNVMDVAGLALSNNGCRDDLCIKCDALLHLR